MCLKVKYKNFLLKIRKLHTTGFFHIFGSNLINKIISFLSGIILVRLLTKVEYGIFTYAWNIYSIIMIFNGMGFVSSALQICSENRKTPNYISKICKFCLKVGIEYDLLLVGIFWLMGLFFPFKIKGVNSLLLMMCCLPLFQYVFELITVYLRSLKRNKEYASLSLLGTCLTFAFQVIGAFFFRQRGLIIGNYLSFVVVIIVAVILIPGVREVHVVSEIVTDDERRSLYAIGIVSMINNGISQMLYLIDIFVLGIVVADETILASYKVATIIPTALAFIPAAFVTYIYPYFAENRSNRKWCLYKYKQILFYMGGFNALISLLLCIFSPFIIELAFGIHYVNVETIMIFRMLSLNYFFIGTFRIIAGNLLVTQRKLKFNTFVALISGVVNIIGDFFLIKMMGARGAALTTILVVLVSSIMNVGYLFYVLRRK